MIPKLSIVCVTYNHEKYIREALNGFIAQLVNFPLEIIVGDDGSSDDTPHIIQEFADRYPEVFVPVLRTNNIGAIPNFADLFSRVRGEFAALCDGDDYWTDPCKLQKQVDFLEANPRFSMCFHPVEQIYDDGSLPRSIIEPFAFFTNDIKQRGYFTIYELISINFIASLSAVYRFRFHERIPSWLAEHKIGDYPMHLLHADLGDIGYIDEIMGVYRKHAQGLWWKHDSQEHHRLFMQDFKELLIDVDSALHFKYTKNFKSVMAEADKIITKATGERNSSKAMKIWTKFRELARFRNDSSNRRQR
jgi:glycosyltransferase involved in cell wall biosynthesis